MEFLNASVRTKMPSSDKVYAAWSNALVKDTDFHIFTIH